MHLVDPAPLVHEPYTEGLMHFHAPEPDHAQAVHWFQVAADAGLADGLAMLGLCQLEGLGMPRDPVQARKRLARASENGSVIATFHLGRMLVAGWGGAADPQRGVKLYAAAAARGHADATFNLASCLQAGWGCLPDRLAAKALFLRARGLGSTLRPQGLRVRARELPAVRALARRFEDGPLLMRLVQERQLEIHLMQQVLRAPERPPRPRAAHSRPATGPRLAHLAALAVGVTLVLLGHAGVRRRLRWPFGDAPHARTTVSTMSTA